MADGDQLDRIWRDGLSGAVAMMAPIDDPRVRVAGRVRRRRVRNRITSAAVALAVAGVALLGVSLTRGSQPTRFATSPPVVRVGVVVGPELRIRFPGRQVAGGEPPRVELPHGLLRFTVRANGGSHRLVIDGVSRFVAFVSPQHDVTVTVRMTPGTYLMHCTLPGHTEAGEIATLIVD